MASVDVKQQTQTAVLADKRGIIKMLILIVIGVVIISVLGFDIRSAVEHPQTQENFSYLTTAIIDIWDTYLEPVWAVVWNIIGPVFEVVWQSAENFSWDNYDGQVQDFMSNSPSLPSGN